MATVEDRISTIEARISGLENTITAGTTLGKGRSIGQATINVEARVAALERTISDKLLDRDAIGIIIDDKIKAANLNTQKSDNFNWFQKPILELKVIDAQAIGLRVV